MPKNQRRVALEPVVQLADRNRGWCVDEHVQMVRLDSKTLDPDFEFVGFLSKQSYEPIRNGFDEHRTSAAGYPDEVVLQHDNRPSVVFVGCCHRHIVVYRMESTHVADEARRRFIFSAKAESFLA